MTIFSPVYALLIFKREMNGQKWYMLFMLIAYPVTTYLAYNPLRIRNVTPWLHYYGISMMLYVLVFGYRYKFQRFNHALAYSVLILFIAGEWWELPIFVFDFLGKTGVLTNEWTGTTMTGYWWFSHIRRVYTGATFILFRKISGFTFKPFTTAIFLVLTFFGIVLLIPIGISGTGYMVFRTRTVCRLLSLMGCGLLAMDGIKDDV